MFETNIDDKLKEECGVFGIYSKENLNVSNIVYYGLYALQHRGEESAGIAVFNNKNIKFHKDIGLVCDVFDQNTINSLKGNISVGHVRYSTSGKTDINCAQPILGKFNGEEFAVAHNGNLINTDKLKKIIEEIYLKNINELNISSDTQIIAKLIELQYTKTIEEALINIMKLIKGSYSLVLILKNKLIGVCDINGIKPMCIGQVSNNYVLASESCALNSIGGTFIRDVKPGEIVTIDYNGIHLKNAFNNLKRKTCAFEYVYFSRADSVINGISVYNARFIAGKKLFEQSKTEGDIVIGVPNSGLIAAEGYAYAAKITYCTGLIKNQYVGRTFIASSQEMRENKVSIKLASIKENLYNKRVIVIDDSIVRGTTSKRLVKLLRGSGVKEIHFKSASPIIKYSCNLGINTQDETKLIGNKKSIEEIRKYIGADTLEYLNLDNFLNIFNNKQNDLCIGCFSGIYPVKYKK